MKTIKFTSTSTKPLIATITWQLKVRLLFLACLILLPRMAFSQMVGGGFTNAGVSGQYYSDSNFTTQAFTRNDVRLDFGTSNVAPPGGSSSPGFSSVGATNWSVTWTGSFVPRFSEVYTFKYFTSGTLSVSINGSAFITQTSATGSPVSQAYSSAFVAGQTYAIQVKYSTGTGPWGMFLHWSSASTPEEAIEPLSMAMAEPGTYNYVVFADQFMSGRNVWAVPGTGGSYSNTLQGQDANGWPQGDAVNIVWEGQANKQGAYELQFQGRAQVSVPSGTGTFSVGTTTWGSTLSGTVGYDSASGEGYNASTNTTQAKFTVTTDQSILYLAFQNTRRLPTDTTATGITNVRLMKPLSKGATTSYPFGTLFTNSYKNAASNFTALRWLTANFNPEAVWTTTTTSTVPFTTPPSYFKALVSDSECWEREIELSNETGKDLYITMPTSADSTYLTNVINLIHYGADSTYTPYTSAQSSPYYPPLNPNLAVYVEWSNEVPWNYAFTNPSYLGNMATADATANNAEWQIINYDSASTGVSGGVLNNGYTMECRLQALRVQQASAAFRASFGDAAMGTHVRIVLEDQYGSPYGMPQFLDHYFNKTDPRSTYTGTAHPVSYYVWGGGGATYYGGNNAQGAQTSTVVANSSFETDSLSAGTTQSTISGWTVSGTAGIYRAATRASVLSAAPTLGTAGNTTSVYSYGYKFTVGAHNIGVYQLGRWKLSGNTGTHGVRLFDSSGNQLATASINTSTGTVGAFEYANISPPVQLTAGASYYLVSDETNGGDTFYDNTTSLTPTSDLSINAPATANYVSGNPWTFATGAAGSNGYGPVDMKYTTSLASIGFPADPPDGNNAAFITGTGTISQSVNFAASGTYAISFYGAWGKPTYDSSNAANPLRYFIDGVEVTPNSSLDFYTQYGTPFVASGYGVNAQIYNFITTIATTLTAGNHTITISGTGTSTKFAYLDEVGIGSIDAIYNGTLGIPQTGYTAMLNTETNWTKAFGIHRVAYEGGWALSAKPQTGGGDSNTLLSDWARWSDPRAGTTSQTILNEYAQSGGDVDGFGTYETWPLWDTDNANSYPVVQGIVTANNALRAEPTNGTLVPAVLKPTFISYADQNSGGTINATDGFVSWNIITPASGNYSFNLSSTGSATIIVDGGNTVAQNGSLFLTKGIHGAKIQSTSGSVTVTSLTVTQPSAPGAPTISSINAGSSAATVNWGTVSGATNYIVEWGTSSGVYTNQSDVGSATSVTLSGLTNNTAYYVAIIAYNSSGRSLPSTEASFIALTDGQTGTLGSWNFTGNTGRETTVPVTSSSPRLTFGALSRGAGYVPGSSVLTNTFSSASISNVYATTLAGAKTANAYDQFTITANSGTQFNLNTLTFVPYTTGLTGTTGIGVTYSTDGTTFPTVTTLTGTGNGTTYTADLTGIPSLQNVSGTTTVTMRIYMYGDSSYSSVALDSLSITGTLTTLAPPTITTQPASAMVSVGGSQTFSVSATANPAITGYQWTKNGTNISGATTTSYTISSVQTTDAATYAVKVTNAIGTTTSANAVLDVLLADAQTAGNLSGTSANLTGANIGTSSAGFSSVRASGNWWVDGSGGNGVNGSSDNFHFEQKSLSGDFQMFVNVAALYDYGGTTSRAGIMIRDGTAAGSNFVALATTTSSSGGFKLISRTSVNSASTESTTSGTGMTYTYPVAWMMLERTGTAIHAFVSSDNVNYYEVTPTAGITWTGISSSLNIGVFTASGQTGFDALAIMNGFEIIQAATTAGPLLTWDFSYDTDPSGVVDGGEVTAASNITAVAMEPSTITRGSDSPAAQLWVNGYWGRGSLNTRSNDWFQSSLANAKTKGSYYQFTVAPMPGAAVSLSSMQLYTYMEGTSSTATMVIEYSTDGFATEDGVSVGTITSISTADIGSSSTINLSTVSALQNFTGTITFRIWGYGFNAYDDKGLGLNPSAGPDVIINGVVQ